MKKFFLSAAVALMALAANAQTACDLVFNDVTVASGATTAVSLIEVSNYENAGFQCDVYAPEGMTVKAAGGALSKLEDPDTEERYYTYKSATQKDGSLRLLMYGGVMMSSIQTGDAKDVAKLTFTLTDVKDGEYVVKVGTIEVADTKGNKVQTKTENSFKITVGTASGIASVNALNVNAPAYNVAGQKVAANAKGLVIVGGKKIMNK